MDAEPVQQVILSGSGWENMIFQRFKEEGLAHFSYVVGDEDTGRAAVIDARRDADVYMDFAREHQLDIQHVLDTHIHADYVSGSRELASVTGARLHLSGYDTGEQYEVGYEHHELREGDFVRVGSLRVEAYHTPGHTPEHLSYLLFEGEASAPSRMFSGDFLFVGSLGRPDLLGEESKEGLARQLYRSVQKVKESDLPDDLLIHPAHGAGSLCGAGLSEAPESTLGSERSDNPYFQIEREETFLERLFASLGEFPPYYPRMKETNSDGAPFVLPVEPPVSLPLEDFSALVEKDRAVVVDLRSKSSYGRAHIPGSVHLKLDSRLNVWAPWIFSYEEDLYFVGRPEWEPSSYEDAFRRLSRVELDRVQGYLEGGFGAWVDAEQPTRNVDQLEPDDVEEQRKLRPETVILDVRTREEYEEGHIPGARWLMIGHVLDQVDQRTLDRNQPVVTVCSSGYRSSVAASLLERLGFGDLGHLRGGFPTWVEAGKPVSGETADEAPRTG